MKFILYITLLCTCWSCAHNTETEKYQGRRNRVVNVHDRIKEIKIEDPSIGSFSFLYTMEDYLIIEDYKSPEEQIYLFDKTHFNYLKGTAKKGQGPNEYEYFSDTLCIGEIIEPIGANDFKPYVGKWNMNTGEIERIKYEHPKIRKKRTLFAASREHGVYVECYNGHDLMSICTLDGELRCNIYGPDWDSEHSSRISYYNYPVFCGDKILALYLGENRFNKDPERGVVSNLPTKFLVFDLEGNYLKTLETGYKVSRVCYDKANRRILMSLDDVMQFASLDLDGLI